MSLLMDALRKAEQQKRLQGSQPESAGIDLVPLEPVPGTPPAQPETAARPPADKPLEFKREPLPELPTRLEDLDEQFMQHAPASRKSARDPEKVEPAVAPPMLQPHPPGSPPLRQPPVASTQAPAASSAAEADRESARNLFEAKQGATKPNRRFALAVGLISLLAAAGIGGYFWWELQPKNTMNLARAPAPMPAPMPAPASPQASPPPAQVTAPAPAVATAPVPVPAVSATSNPLPAAPTTPPVAAAEAPRAAETMRPERPQAPPPRDTDAPDKPIRVSSAPLKLNPALDQAYQAFSAGDIERARTAWRKVLTTDPRNSDALHGLAAIALQERQPEIAADLYQKVLDANPKDGLAVAALLALKTPSDSVQAESRLKTLLAEQPDSAPLNFALGNLMARTARWADAQQAYFKAHTADPGNPDYLYNLAVSLDQLHQPRLAIQYYNRAAVAARQQTPGFDPSLVETRLKALQSETQQ